MFVHDSFVALGTEHSLNEWRAAPIVDQHGGRLAIGKPTIAPLHQGDQSGGEVLASVGQDILIPNGSLLVGNTFEHASLDELAETVRQKVLGDAEVVLELAEAPHTSERIPQDQQCPSVTDDAQRRCDRAVDLIRYGDGCVFLSARHDGFKGKPSRLHFATECASPNSHDTSRGGCDDDVMPIVPAPLQPGDHLRVIAPSTTLGIVSETNRADATRRLEALGFSVSFGQHVDDVDLLSSASVPKRLADLHEAFADSSVDGILTAIGGYNANDLLRHIDFDLIAAHPKVLCGFSDITALTSAITARTGLITFSGQHYSTFAMQQHFDQSLDWFTSVVMERSPTVLSAAPTWSDDEWYLDQNDRRIEPSEGHWILSNGESVGVIAGGNLCTLNLLHGTEWMPDLADAILFVEDDLESHPATFARDLVSLSHQPGFDQIAALIIGRFQRASNMDRATLAGIVASLGLPRSTPVVANVDVGHTDPMATIPIGGHARVSLDAEATTIEVTW